MSTADVMAIIFFAFFLAGVAVGVVVVAALSARRRTRRFAGSAQWRRRPRADGYTCRKSTMGRTNLPGGKHAATERGHSRLRAAGSGKGTGRTLTLEAAMAGVAVAAIVVFLIGLLIGAIATVAVAVRREGRARIR